MDEPDPLVDTLVGGKYRVVRGCGRGGMGAVYEAQNVAIGKRVALKFLDPEAAANRDAVQRFLREAQAASAAESPHIVQVFDIGEHPPGQPYLVMEFLRGEDLASRLRRLGPLSLELAVHVAVQTLRGLRRAHDEGIVHRDLKPDNVFLADNDDEAPLVKIVDFGISKITRRPRELDADTLTTQGVVLGTPFYMAPEQAQGMPGVDGRVDLWAVGAILFECLAGRRPHLGRTYEQVIISICTTDAPDVREIVPAVPAPLAAVIARALARARDERFRTAGEMIEALRGAAPELVSAPPGSSVDPALERTEAVARPVPAPRPGAHAPEARTRVSWTRDDARAERAAPAAPPSLPVPAARSRLQIGLLGLSTALAAFFAAMLFMTRGERRDPDAAPGIVHSRPPASSIVAAPMISASPVDRPRAEVAGDPEAEPPTDASAPGKPKSAASATGPRPVATKPSGSAGGLVPGLELKTEGP